MKNHFLVVRVLLFVFTIKFKAKEFIWIEFINEKLIFSTPVLIVTSSFTQNRSNILKL